MKFFKQLGSLKITFILLLILAAVSILGTVIVQRENAQFYLKNYGEFLGKGLLFVNANDLYNGWAYQSILFILGLNLFICTINSFSLALFKNKKKIALFLIHCSIFFIFTGAIVSRLLKYSEYLTMIPGQTIELKQGKAKIIFDKFDMEYYPQTKQPKVYCSNITLKENDQIAKEHKIIVNHPFKYKGYGFYQSSFEVLADLEMVISHMGHEVWQGNWRQGQSLFLPGQGDFRLEITHFIPDAEIDQDGRITMRSHELGSAALLITLYQNDQSVGEEWVFIDQRISDMFSQKIEVFDFKIKRLDVFYATIIQVIKDPGLGFIWTGFLMLFSGMIGFLFQKNNIRSV
ncbi:MAG: cytochrome c biogenesis protein ResB [Candidatus Omnitrophica bacterium]|nr:cytochrome c biogenesis protein ResB [Candidatus Omnitrophota bacterium]